MPCPTPNPAPHPLRRCGQKGGADECQRFGQRGIPVNRFLRRLHCKVGDRANDGHQKGGGAEVAYLAGVGTPVSQLPLFSSISHFPHFL